VVELDGDVPGLQRALAVRVVERLLDLEPGLIGVLLTGSYAKGTASLTSDLDLVALTASIPRTEYRMWFERGS
jgi:predicted nucleotidyltransferase